MSDEEHGAPAGTITITVPYRIRRAAEDDQGTFSSWDRRDGVWIARGRREVRVFVSDIHKAIDAAWPGPPASEQIREMVLALDRGHAFCLGVGIEDPARRERCDPIAQACAEALDRLRANTSRRLGRDVTFAFDLYRENVSIEAADAPLWSRQLDAVDAKALFAETDIPEQVRERLPWWRP